MRNNFFLTITILFLCCCQSINKENDSFDDNKGCNDLDIKITDGIIERENMAYMAICALSTLDLKSLTNYILEDSGLTISAYSGGSYLFKKQTIQEFSKSDSSILYWGTYDGSDNDIKMSLSKFIQTWIYNGDFMSVTPMEIVKSLKNGKSFYSNDVDFVNKRHPNSFIKSFHMPADSNDSWKIIDIVMIPYKYKWYIVEIRHRCWTI